MRSPRLLARIAPLVLAGLSACGGPLLSAEVVVDRFCLTQRVTGLPPMVAGAVTTPAIPVQLQLPPLLRTHGSTAIVRLLDGRIAPVTAGVTLDGIDRLDLLLQPGPVTAAHYARSGPGPIPSIALSGDGVDVAPLVQSGKLQVVFSVAASGPPPSTFWDADLELCFYGKTVVSYL